MWKLHTPTAGASCERHCIADTCSRLSLCSVIQLDKYGQTRIQVLHSCPPSLHSVSRNGVIEGVKISAGLRRTLKTLATISTLNTRTYCRIQRCASICVCGACVELWV